MDNFEEIPVLTLSKSDSNKLKSSKPLKEEVQKLLLGLHESFPDYSQDFLLFYIYTKEGLHNCFTIDQLSEVGRAVFNIEKTKKEKSGESNKSNSNMYSKNISKKSSPNITQQLLSIEKQLSSNKNLNQNMDAKNDEKNDKDIQGIYVVSRERNEIIKKLDEKLDDPNSLMSDDYEYTQLNTSTMDILKDLESKKDRNNASIDLTCNEVIQDFKILYNDI